MLALRPCSFCVLVLLRLPELTDSSMLLRESPLLQSSLLKRLVIGCFTVIRRDQKPHNRHRQTVQQWYPFVGGSVLFI